MGDKSLRRWWRPTARLERYPPQHGTMRHSRLPQEPTTSQAVPPQCRTQKKRASARAGPKLKSDAGTRAYVRARDLPRLLPLWPRKIASMKAADHARLLARLRKALRAERQRGLGGHWTYDLARHAQLLRAYRAETAAHLRVTCANRRRDNDANGMNKRAGTASR